MSKITRRELRGLAILLKGGMIRKLTDRHFLVKSARGNKEYNVVWINNRWQCDCQDFKKRRTPCKHIYAILYLLKLPEIITSLAIENVPVCPKCGERKNIVKRGIRKNKSGPVQLYQCKSCGYRFSEHSEIRSIKHNPALLIIAIDLFYKGLSLRNIQNHISLIYGVNIPHTTLYYWIVKFTKKLREYYEELTSDVGDTWLADEMVVKVDGKERYLWNIMDYESRYLLVSKLSFGRSSKEALKALKEAIMKAGKKPKELRTDGLKSYIKALSALKGDIKHVYKVRFTDPANNNRVERLNETIRSWLKSKKKLGANAQLLIDGFRIYYNHIRPHLSLSDVPASNKIRWASLLKGNFRLRGEECGDR